MFQKKQRKNLKGPLGFTTDLFMFHHVPFSCSINGTSTWSVFVLDLSLCATTKFEISSNTRNKSVTMATNHPSVPWVGIWL